MTEEYIVKFDDDDDTEELGIPTVRWCEKCKAYLPGDTVECPMCKETVDDS